MSPLQTRSKSKTRATTICETVFHNHSEGYYSLFLVFMYAPLFSRTSHVTTEPLPAERCRGVSPLQTQSKSNGPPQYINPYVIINPDVLPFVFGVHVCTALQQNLACIYSAVFSGEVKGCPAAADAVTNTLQTKNTHYYMPSLARTRAGSTMR